RSRNGRSQRADGSGLRSRRGKRLRVRRFLEFATASLILCWLATVMRPSEQARTIPPGFPRDFRIAGHWINSYKVLLCVGIYVGVLVSAAFAQSLGLSPLRIGLSSLASAIAG